jgi:hypothetical protein
MRRPVERKTGVLAIEKHSIANVTELAASQNVLLKVTLLKAQSFCSKS